MMKLRKSIIFLLLFSICLMIGHDFLPYHSHGISHTFDNSLLKNKTCNCCSISESIIVYDDESHNHVDDCDGDHQQCTICFYKQKNPYIISHNSQIKYFPDVIFLIENNKENKIIEYDTYLKSDQYLIPKIILYRTPCVLRGPPTLV